MNERDEKNPEDAPPKSGALTPITQEQAQANAQALVQMGEQMKDMNSRLESVRDMLQKLPGTIGAAVAQALTARPPANASGPPVPVQYTPDGDIAFERGQKISQGGKTVAEGRALPVPKPIRSKLTQKPKA